MKIRQDKKCEDKTRCTKSSQDKTKQHSTPPRQDKTKEHKTGCIKARKVKATHNTMVRNLTNFPKVATPESLLSTKTSANTAQSLGPDTKMPGVQAHMYQKTTSESVRGLDKNDVMTNNIV